MLLSMYLSYRWARTVKPRSYLTRITLSILVMSFLSVVFPVSLFTLAFFPLLLLTNLSWPALFAIWWGRSYGTEPLRYITIFYIHFFTIEITIYNALEYFIIAFSLSLSIEILGALFGYLIGKKLKIQFFHHKLWNTLWGFAGIGCIVLGAGELFLDLLGIINPLTSISLIGFGMLLLGTILVSRLLGPFPWIRT